MMVFGAILIFTLILSIFGIIFGLVGFIMFIVGCVTSSHSRQQVVYNYPPAYQAQPQNVSYTPSPNQKFCGHAVPRTPRMFYIVEDAEKNS